MRRPCSARVPSSLDTGAPLDVETKARLMRRLSPGKDVDPGAEVLSADERRVVFDSFRAEFPGLAGFPRRDWGDGVEAIFADRMAAAA